MTQALSHFRFLPTEWEITLIGVLASLPAAVILNWLPNSDATLGGSIMIVGAFIAGAIATARSTDADAVGLRTGFLAGVVGILLFVGRELNAVFSGRSAAWPLSKMTFFVVGSVLLLCLAPLFGLMCSRVGGWIANIIISQRN